MALLPRILPRNDAQRRSDAYSDVLRMEAKIGGQLFGPVPRGRRREFFCLDQHTWVWHEEWTDSNGKRQVVITRYHVRPDGVLKTQGDQAYQQVGRDELRNLYHAARLYGERVPAMLQQQLQAA